MNIITALRRKGFSQQCLADVAGVSQSTISRIASGKTKTIKLKPFQKLKRFAETVGMAKSQERQTA